jgi:divalent metal cation (Fe/Co/Zn/Cd) transporter
VIVDPGASAVQAHQVAVDAEHNLLHALPRLAAALVHARPQAQAGDDHHAVLAPIGEKARCGWPHGRVV